MKATRQEEVECDVFMLSSRLDFVILLFLNLSPLLDILMRLETCSILALICDFMRFSSLRLCWATSCAHSLREFRLSMTPKINKSPNE